MNRTTIGAGAALLLAAALAGGLAAQAQPAMQYPRGPGSIYPDTAPPIAPADMPNYCVFDNHVYSLGSGLCFGRNAFVCVPSQGPATGNRAYWTSKEDTVFGRPGCG
jgi:hypothetical protein